MKVFISWSGELSKQVAEILNSWIEDVLQGTKVWISSEDIDKGALWFGDITTQLAETSIGILCLTRENITAPWILFEAGALSKGLSKSRVCPLLVNLNHSDLTPPLSQFNGTLPLKEDMLKLVKCINAQNGEKALLEDRVEKAFSRWWSDFENKFAELVRSFKPAKEAHQRPMPEMVEEILEIARLLQRKMQNEGLNKPYDEALLRWFFEQKNSPLEHPAWGGWKLDSGAKLTREQIIDFMGRTQNIPPLPSNPP